MAVQTDQWRSRTDEARRKRVVPRPFLRIFVEDRVPALIEESIDACGSVHHGPESSREEERVVQDAAVIAVAGENTSGRALAGAEPLWIDGSSVGVEVGTKTVAQRRKGSYQRIVTSLKGAAALLTGKSRSAGQRRTIAARDASLPGRLESLPGRLES